MGNCRRRGFTLIELLVVIAIIAILAAILFPVFANAKRTAIENRCMYNQKQWGAAMLRYCDDNNGAFPWAGCSNALPHSLQPSPLGQGGKYKSCMEALLPYVGKTKQMCFCPLWKGSPESKNWPSSLDWSYWYFCGHNSNVHVHAHPKSELCGYKMSDVWRPSKKPCLTEVNAPHVQNTKDYGTATAVIGQTQAYCDGHAALTKGTWTQIYNIGYTGRDGSAP